MALSEDAVREELKKVIDPELFINIVDLGCLRRSI
jgi:metal-sulfur cluster biosynthetic enzyme